MANYKCDMCGTVQPVSAQIVLSRYQPMVTVSNASNTTNISNFDCISCGNGKEGVHSF